MAELEKSCETLYPHELLYKTRIGMVFSFFMIGIILSVIVNLLTIFLITGDL
jgi:hypothetical protein